ncbi:MAG: transposase [Holophagae bacterium]|nr:transposase [Holophagae bacterium]
MMESGRNCQRGERPTPLSGGERSDPELSGVEAAAGQTILKVTGLEFPVPDPEVEEKPRRRRFSASYKLEILREADQCTMQGQLGALLRREGLYYSNLHTWRKSRERSELSALSEKKRGCKPNPRNPLSNEVAQLKHENERLTTELKKARIIIDVQKKISDLLEIEPPPTDPEKTD